MNMTITLEELDNLCLKDNVQLICKHCGIYFYADKAKILRALNPNSYTTAEFCSRSCSASNQSPSINVNCDYCKKIFKKQPAQIKKSKNNFCSLSCSGIYYNKFTKRKTNKSKAEIYLVELIKSIFPNIKIIENSRKILPSNIELDIFLTDYSIAIEINGITHFSPIYGEDKFLKIIRNDEIKKEECKENKINLIIIDISKCNSQKKTIELLNMKFTNIIQPLLK